MTASVADSMRQRFQDLLERHGVQTRPRDRYRTSHTALPDAPTSTAPAKQLTTAAPVALAVIEFLGPSIDARKLGATNRAWSFYVRHAEGWGEVLRRRAPQLYHSLIDGYCSNLNAGGSGGAGCGGGGVLTSSSKTNNATTSEATNPSHKRSNTQAVGLISIAWLDELDSLQRRLAPVGSDVTRRHPPPRKPLLARLKSVALRLPVSPHIVVLGIPQSGQTTLMSSLLRAGELGDELAGAEDEGGIYSSNLSVATNAPPAAAPPVGGRSGSPVIFGAPSTNSQGVNNNGGGGSPTAGIGMHIDMQKISAPPDGRWGFFVVGVQGEELSSAPSYAPVKMTYHGSVVTPAVTHDHDSLNNTLATTSSSSRQFPSPTVPQTRRNVAPPATPSNRPSREGVLRKTNDNGEKDTQQGGVDGDKDGDEHTTPSTAVFDENGDDVKHPSTMKHRSSGGVGRHDDDDIESDDTSNDDDNKAAVIQGLDDEAARAAAKDRTLTHRRRRSGYDDDDTMVSVQSDCSGCSGCSGCAEVGESTYMHSLRDDASSMAWPGSPATKRLSSHSFRGRHRHDTDRHHKHRNHSRSRSRGRAHRHSSKKEKGHIDKSENAGHQDDGEAVGERQQHAHHRHGRECACHRCVHDRDGRTYDDDDADLDDELESGRMFFTASENSASFDDDDDSFMDSSSFSDGASRHTHDFLDAHSSDDDGTSISDDESMTDGSSSSVLSIGTAPVSFGFNEDEDDADLLSEMMHRSSSLRLGYDSRRESRLGDSRHSRNNSDAFFSRGRGRRMQLSAHSTPHHAHSHPPQRDVACLDQDRRRPPHRTPHTSAHSRHRRDNTHRHGVDGDHDLDDRSEKQQGRQGRHHGRGSGYHRRGHSHGRPRYQKKASSLSALSGGAVVGTPCRASRSSTLLHGDQEPTSPLFPDATDRRHSSSDKSTAIATVAMPNNDNAENKNASTSTNGTVPGVMMSGMNAVAPKSALKRDDSAVKKKAADVSDETAQGKTDTAVAPAIARKAPPPLTAPKSRPAVPSRRPDVSPSAVAPATPSRTGAAESSSTRRPTVGVSKGGAKPAPLAPSATAPGVLHPPSSMPAGLHAPPSPSTLPRLKLSAPTPTAGGLKAASLSRSPPKVRSPGVAPTKPHQATTPVQLSQSLGSVGGTSPANNANKVNGNGRNLSPGGVSRVGAGATSGAPEGTKTVTFGKTVSMVESEHTWWGGGDRNDDDPLYSDKLESGSGGGSLSKDVNDRIKALTESIRGLRDKGDEILRRREEKALEKRERRKAAAANKQAFGKLSALGMTASSTSSLGGGGNTAGGNGNGAQQRSSSTQQPQSASSVMNATAPTARVSSSMLGGGGVHGTNGDQGRSKVTGVSESNVSGGESDSDSDGEWRGADRDTGDGSPDGTSGKKKSLARQVVTRVKRAVENAELSLREALMAANFGESSDEESEDDDPAFTEATHSALPTSAPHWGSMLRHGPCHALVFVVDCRSVASAEASLAALKDKVLPYLAGGPAYPKLVQPASSILASQAHQHFRAVPSPLGQGQIQGSVQGQNPSGRVAPQSPGRWQPGSGSAAVGPTPKEKTTSPMAVTPRAVITGPLSAATPRVGVAPTPRSNALHPVTPNNTNTVNTPGGVGSAGSRSASRSASVPAAAPGPAPGHDADDNDGVAFGGPKALPPACRNLLVFANGQDVPHAVPPETVAVRVKTAVQWWGLDGTLQWRVIGSAAAAPRSGPALWDAMRWLK